MSGFTCSIGDDSILTRESATKYIREIFNREMQATLNNARAGSRRDDSLRELTQVTAGLYSSRVVRELLQNAYDGTFAVPNPRVRIRFDARSGPFGTLYIANDGIGFREENVDAITNPALSNKIPGNFIGHKGIGFRSVELISGEPQIFSVGSETTAEPRMGFDGFCFGFATAQEEEEWLRDHDVIEYASQVIGRTHRLQLPYPLEEDPADVREFAQQGFATVIRLPLRDEPAARAVIEELVSLRDDKAPIPLFLERLSGLAVECTFSNGIKESWTATRKNKGHPSYPKTRSISIDLVTVDRRRFLTASKLVDADRFQEAVERSINERHRLERWRDWKGDAVVSVALALGGDAGPGHYYAFLPMPKAAPFAGHVDAPFFPDADRKDVDFAIPLNSLLLDVAAEVCIELAETFANNNEKEKELAFAAVDALSWTNETSRLFRALERKQIDAGELKLPSMRRRTCDERWARLDEILEWDDSSFHFIKSDRLVRVCDLALLSRGVGSRRQTALAKFVAGADFSFEPDERKWSEWAPSLVADLAAKRKTIHREWEQLYSDLAHLGGALVHLKGKVIFRDADGKLAAANSDGDNDSPEVFIKRAETSPSQPRRRRPSHALPSGQMARQMVLADPALNWSPSVTNAFVTHGLATEFSLPSLLARAGSLLGKSPRRQSVLAALNWAFTSWIENKSPAVETALKSSGLPVPMAKGGFGKPANARFSVGWRDTQGILLSELCAPPNDALKGVASIRDSLLVSWDAWPLRDKGSQQDWIQFLRLLGVRDGLRVVHWSSRAQTAAWWNELRRPGGTHLSVERNIGTEWRQELAGRWSLEEFKYQSGDYSAGKTLYGAEIQANHSALTVEGKLAFARLFIALLADVADPWWQTRFTRPSGNWDEVKWPSPFSAFAKRGVWVPVASGDDYEWLAPSECWYAPRSDGLPRFVKGIERSLRERLDSSSPLQKVLIERCGLRRWNDPTSAVSRLLHLGELLGEGIVDADRDTFRKECRDAWADWCDKGYSSLPAKMIVSVEVRSGLDALPISKDVPGTIFLGEGLNPGLEFIVVELGYALLATPRGCAIKIAEGLRSAFGIDTRLIDDAGIRIFASGTEIDEIYQLPYLIPPGFEWLAEICVLVLEFSSNLNGRNTVRARQTLYDALRKVRLMKTERIEVQIGNSRDFLPSMLNGVLALPGSENPKIIFEGTGSITWQDLGRIAGAMAVAAGRSDLQHMFRSALLGLSQKFGDAPLFQPSEDDIASALAQPVERVIEIQRSLRSTSKRLFDWLIPSVHALHGPAAAELLRDRGADLVDDSEVANLLAQRGVLHSESTRLIDVCRNSDSLDAVRRELGLDLLTFNKTLSELGEDWVSIHFEERLRAVFSARLEERRPKLQERVRDSFMQKYEVPGQLKRYVKALTLDWIDFEVGWIQVYDTLPFEIVDARIDSLLARILEGSPKTGEPLEKVRQSNRALIAEAGEGTRRIIRAWVANDPQTRKMPAVWNLPVDRISREILASGVLDFVRLDKDALPSALHLAGLWPEGMPQSYDMGPLGISADDVNAELKAERERTAKAQRERRSLTFGTLEIDGGSETWLNEVAAALKSALESKAFRNRSGTAELKSFGQSDRRLRGRRSRRDGPPKDPQYMSDEQRNLIGFAGELAAYKYLQQTVRDFADVHWVSAVGRRYLGLAPGDDSEGADFCVPRAKQTRYYEVKAHAEDPGFVDLSASEVAKAGKLADDRGGRWRILYVANVLDPSRLTVYELDNPFSKAARMLYRETGSRSIRLMIERLE